MNDFRSAIRFISCAIVLTACAGNEPVERQRDPTIKEIAQMLGCTDEQMPVCIEVNCEPRDYHCANRVDVEKLFRARDFQH